MATLKAPPVTALLAWVGAVVRSADGWTAYVATAFSPRHGFGHGGTRAAAVKAAQVRGREIALALWLATQRLPTHLTPARLLASPDSLTRVQRDWLRAYVGASK